MVAAAHNCENNAAATFSRAVGGAGAAYCIYGPAIPCSSKHGHILPLEHAADVSRVRR